MKKFECYYSNHYLYFILSILYCIFQFFLCYSFILLYYNKNESCCSSISKFIISNHSLILFFIKVISLILYSYHKIHSINSLICLFFLLSSIIVLYFTRIEYFYQYGKNTKLKIHFFLSYVYLFTCLLLGIGYLIRKKNFNGLIYILCVLTIMDFLYFFTLNENEITVDIRNLSALKEFQIFNQLNLLISSLNKIEIDRKHLLNLASYCQKNNNIKEQFDKERFLESYKNDEIKYFIYYFIDSSYRTAINKFEKSIILKVGYSSFLYLILKKYNKSYILFYDLLNSEKILLNESQEFYIFCINKKFKNFIFHNGIDKTNISLKYQCNRLIYLISEISEIYLDFWSLLLNSQKYQDINLLTQIGTKIYKLIIEIDYKYNKIIQTKFKERQITLLYYSYKKDILNDFSFCYKYEDIIDLDDFFSKSININDINSLTSTSTFQFLIISGKIDNFGTILNISQEICNILGYSNEELIGQNMNILIPDFMRKNHDQVIIKKFKNIKLMKDYETALKPHIFLMKTSSKFIFPIGLLVGTIYDDDNQPLIFCKINLEQEQNLISNLHKFCQILTDCNLIIQFFTANCINLLGLHPKMINSNIDILTFIKEINEEFMKNYHPFIHKKKIDKNQIKLSILKKYMPGESEKIITFNKEKCKIKIIQINLNGKFSGFLFNLTIISKEEEEMNIKVTFNNNKTISESNIKLHKTENDSIIKISKTKRHSINLSQEFCDINKNYLPESNEVLFNYNEKAFFLNKKKGNKKKEKSNDELSKLLKQKFLEKKLELEKEIKSSSEELSDYSENSSYSSNTSSNNESSSFSSSVELEKQDNLNNEIEKRNDYYHVKINKINYSIYNYQTNSFVTLPNVEKGKIEEIIQIENKINEKKLEEMNKPTILTQEEKIQIGTELILPELERRSKIFYLKNKAFFEKKLFSKKLSNSVLIILIIEIIHILIAISSGTFIIIFCTDNKNLIQKFIQLIIYLINLSDNSNILLSFSLFLASIQNEKYVNYYFSRDDFKALCRNRLLNIYNETSELITELISRMNSMSKSYQNQIYDLNLTLFVIDDQLNLNKYITDIITIIRETNYAVYNFANTEDKDISFKNLDYNFIFYNTNDDFIYGIINLLDISINEFMNKYKNVLFKNSLLIMFVFIFLILCCLSSYIGFNYLIKEKEKYLKFFFFIDVNYIRNNIYKCQKYINLNKKSGFDSKYFLSNPQVKLENESNEDDDEFSNLSKEVSSLESFKNSLKYNKLKKNKNIKTNFISEKKNICINLFIYFSYIFILIGILIIIIVGNKYYYDKISHLIIIYNLQVFHRSCFLILYNYLRILMIYSSFNIKNEFLENKMILISQYFSSIFELHQMYEHQINSNISLYGLYVLSNKKYKNLTKNSLCPYFQNASIELNLSCEDLASNISNYGISALMIYYIHSMENIYENVKENLFEAKNSGFIFDELIYGTEEYKNILPNNTEDLEKYNQLNPFNLINLEQLKHLNILNERIFIPAHQELTNSICLDIYNILQKIEKNQNSTILCFFLVIFVFNIILYFPYLYQKNEEIKQIKKMLILIPQNILYEILVDEDKEKEKKEN